MIYWKSHIEFVWLEGTTFFPLRDTSVIIFIPPLSRVWCT